VAVVIDADVQLKRLSGELAAALARGKRKLSDINSVWEKNRDERLRPGALTSIGNARRKWRTA
jgi:hypothetical protein